MNHRHLNHQRLTLAALDDIILRGNWQDWQDLRSQVLAQPDLLDKLLQLCSAQIKQAGDYAQRHYFWLHYAQMHRAEQSMHE